MKLMLKNTLLLCFTVLLLGCADKQADIFEVNGKTYLGGVDFTELDSRVPFDYAPGTNVVEVFWYGCPHCQSFEPRLSEWLSHEAPKGARFSRSPAIWNEPMAIHAKAYFMAIQMDLLDEIHEQLFTEIINVRAAKDASTHINRLMALFAQYDVDQKRFMESFNSPYVNGGVQNSLYVMKEAGIRSTPSFVVNGKYVLAASAFQSTEELLDVVAYLVESELDAGPWDLW